MPREDRNFIPNRALDPTGEAVSCALAGKPHLRRALGD